jgi:beta-galactosidase
VKLSLSGNGDLIGSGNASPFDMKSVGKPEITTYHGSAQAIVRPHEKAGSITLKASGEGLGEGMVEIHVQ